MPQDVVPPIPAIAAGKQPPLLGRHERREIAHHEISGGEQGARRFGQPRRGTEMGHSAATAFHVGGQMIAWQDAVAVEKQQEVAGGEAGTAVADRGEPEAVVWL